MDFRFWTIAKRREKLPLPSFLVQLIETGRWKHPGDEVLRVKVPFVRDPLVFLESKESMLLNSGPLMGKSDSENELFSEYRGSAHKERDLPWIDVEKSIFIAVNKIPGDDVGIALDYRPGIQCPRVVCGDWHSGNGCVYHEIAPSIEAFAENLGL